MKIKDLNEVLQANILNKNGDFEHEVTSAFIGDLLSWVMAKGNEQQVWITVQTHLNVIAVASLKEFPAIIFAHGVEVPQESIDKADEENIILLSSNLSAYEIACKLSIAGLNDSL